MKKTELVIEVRELVFQHYFGVLATQTNDHPFGSLTRYALDKLGQPLLLLSRIAEHTKNLSNDNKVSLFILKPDTHNIQESQRVNLSGKLILQNSSMEDFQNNLKSYFSYFPETREYFEQLDFDLYKLEIEHCRYIGGFAAAHKLSGSDYRQENVLDEQSQERILSHMNADHKDAIVHYCIMNHIQVHDSSPEMVAIDAHGFQVRIGKTIQRINFPKPITDAISARETLVAMANK